MVSLLNHVLLLLFVVIDLLLFDVDDAAQPKSKSSKRVANPLSDDELVDRVVNDWYSR